MSSETNIETLKNLFGAISSKSIDECAEYIDDDVLVEVPYPAKGIDSEVCGKEAVMTGLAGIDAFFESFKLIFSEIYATGNDDVVIAEWKSDAKVAGMDVTFQNTYIGVFKFKGGKVAFWREYFNPEITNKLTEATAYSLKSE